ncbi:latent-transforming growth factor beta-binding protein [Salix suchowensis]|nr:latent-transforming growth factor beta-binding protein [Salix suchowensis]
MWIYRVYCDQAAAAANNNRFVETIEIGFVVKTVKIGFVFETLKSDSSSKQTPPPPPLKHEVNVTIRNTCCNECNEGSCGSWCHCHSISQPPCWVPYSRPPCVPWEDGFCSCRRRGYVVCICEDHSPSCTIM